MARRFLVMTILFCTLPFAGARSDNADNAGNGVRTQTVCAERSSALSHLMHKYAEAPVAMGMASNGGVLEVLSSDDGGSWTILVTMPNGLSCMLATGQGWEFFNPVVAGTVL